jgi:hypothetical protein
MNAVDRRVRLRFSDQLLRRCEEIDKRHVVLAASFSIAAWLSERFLLLAVLGISCGGQRFGAIGLMSATVGY